MEHQLDSSDNWSKLAYWMRNAAFEHCPEALMLLDPIENKYIDCNVAASALLGYPRQKLLMMPISKIHDKDLGELIVFTEEVLIYGRASSSKIHCKNSKGDYISVELQAARTVINQRELIILSLKDSKLEKLKYETKEINRISSSSLLELKHLENMYHQHKLDNALMLSSVGDGLYCVDTEGLCTFMNPAAKKLLGRTSEEVLGQNVHYIHHHTHDDGSHYHVEDCPIYAAVRDGVIYEGKQELFWKHDGPPFPVEFTSTPIISDGKIIGAVVVFRDISERLKTEQYLKDTLDELNELKARLEDENAYLQQEFLIEKNFYGIVGESSSIKHVMQQIDLVAKTDANVLVTGESGTGKELIAMAIHEASNRKEKSLIRVNCAAIPHELFESEFFGHIKGAYTGAVRDRIGRFELANGGTIFLDEVGEIPLNLQSKLLRVIQEGQFERVGEDCTRMVDVRIIAATNRDLKQESLKNNFREDLFFRLNVFPIHSPALRERAGDIALLAMHFLQRESQKYGATLVKLKKSSLKQIEEYLWPGNIRELQNVIERAVITAVNGVAELNLPNGNNATPDIFEDYTQQDRTIISDIKIQEIVENNMLAALEQCHWKVFGDAGAAKLLGMKPTTLASRIKRLGLSRDTHKKSSHF
ncbi:sigma 54-interacting transcriptional regulator [Psychromonas sp. SP041]|uniref:sigma 54-interacting transcriptional regulator n=1 Tax=Psychromonas sp. SP041 TaxID=1365007 RepID=UPI0003F9D0A1|nr:sigma 54-interacting transcriptional regulator [Psychromonas sp. SP041]